MKKAIMFFWSLLLVISLTACEINTEASSSNNSSAMELPEPGTNSTPSVLIAYFSRVGNTELTDNADAMTSASINLQNGEFVGNTELLAQWIQKKVGGDLFLIQTEEPYPEDYDATVEAGEGQNRDNARPALATHVDNINDYDVIFLGYPIWAYDLPVAVYSFLEEYDLSGKTIIPFCTNGGSGLIDTVETIGKLQPNSDVFKGLAVRDKDVLDAQSSVIEWLQENDASSVKSDVSTLNIDKSPILESSAAIDDKTKKKINIHVNNTDYTLVLYDNASTQALISKMPLTVSMDELNGNEKYYNTNDKLPTDSQNIGAIHTGDFMLYGSDCLVLFYKDFQTSYNYTRLGYIEDVSGLADTLGSGSIQATFSVAE